MIELLISILISNIILIGFLFYKEHKNSQTIREILASKLSQETFEKLVIPEKKEENEQIMASEELLDDIDAEELAEKLAGSIKE
jgi:hypothetical protein